MLDRGLRQVMNCSYLVKQASCKTVVSRGLAQIPMIQKKSKASLKVFQKYLLIDLEKIQKYLQHRQ